MRPSQRRALGWAATIVSALGGSFWAFWGIAENFHEGWYLGSLWANVGLMLVQYLLPAVLLVGAAVLAIHLRWAGAAVHFAAALWAAWFFRGASALAVYPLIVFPLLALGVCYAIGRPEPRRWSVALVVGLPLITALVVGAEPAYRVSQRLDDGNRSSRRIAQNGVDLVWAPAGPGWPEHGVSWSEATRRCRYLTDDGRSLGQDTQDIWRLPTVEEAVRSTQHHGRNARGVWSTVEKRASYHESPDKESPLWNTHSKVIYWWTATSPDDKSAYVIAYNGLVKRHPKSADWGYLGFRAVKEGRPVGLTRR